LKENIQPAFYPVLINLKRFPCLIVGGGKVAYRKALSLLEFHADITVISPKFCKPLMELHQQEKIKVIKKSYSKQFILGFKIIFSATDNQEINKTVSQDCREEGILLNVVDNTPLCDFILPANVKRGDLVVSISTQGKAPFFTKAVKEELEKILPEEYKEVLELAAEFRKRLLKGKNKYKDQNKTKLFDKFLSINWVNILAEKGKVKSKMDIDKMLRELNL